MKIIDAHVHVFEVLKGFGPKGEMRAIGNGKARWSNGDEVGMIPAGYGDVDFTGESLIRILDENHVEQAVLLQGSFYGFQNEYTAEVLRAYPDRLIGAATLDPFCTCAPEIYDRLMGEYPFQALKFETSSGGGLMGYHRDYVIDEVLDPFIQKAAAARKTLVLDIGSPHMPSFQPEAVRRIAQKYPELRIVVCHLLAPHQADEEILKRSLEMLALPNVWFDLAALPYNVMPDRYPYPIAGAFIRDAMEIVGHKKLLWGTDVPSVLIYETYQDLLNYVREIPGITEAQVQDLVYSNALEAYSF